MKLTSFYQTCINMIIIGLLFILVPNYYIDNVDIFYRSILVAGLLLGSIKTNNFYPIYLLVVLSCIPQVFHESDDDTLGKMFGRCTIATMYSMVLYLLMSAITREGPLRRISKIYYLFPIMGLIWAITLSTNFEFSIALYFFLFLVSFYYVLEEYRIDRDLFCRMMDTIYYATFIYAVLQLFFKYSPYEFVSIKITEVLDYVRASGLMRHPLYFSCATILYSCVVISRLFYSPSKIAYFNFALVTVGLIISASRTSFVILLIELFFVMKFCKVNKTHFIYIILGTSLLAIFGTFLEESIQTLIYRTQDTQDISITNRYGVYFSSFQCFVENPLGVGITNAPKLIYTRYKVAGMIDEFTTLDNQILTYLVSYGIFSIIPIYSIYRFFKNLYNESIKHVYLLACTLIFLICFSFNVFNSPVLLMWIAATIYGIKLFEDEYSI